MVGFAVRLRYRDMRTLLLIAFVSLQAACVTSEPGPLALDLHTDSRVAGTYVHREVLIGFDISRLADTHSTHFTYADGTALIDIEVSGNHQVVDVLGGELVIDGVLGSSDPVVHGNMLTMRKLDTRRELFAIQELYAELEGAGVDAALVSPSSPPPMAARVLAAGDTTYWWTTFGPATRTYELINATADCAAVSIDSLPYGREVVLATGSQQITRYGWSGLLEVTNLGEWKAWDACGPSPVSVRLLP
jgi:hypothetical protein